MWRRVISSVEAELSVVFQIPVHIYVFSIYQVKLLPADSRAARRVGPLGLFRLRKILIRPSHSGTSYFYFPSGFIHLFYLYVEKRSITP